MPVQHLSRSRLDSSAWNLCVDKAANGLIYAYTWYLDAVTARPDWRWAGLVLPDSAGGYAAVMPVPLRRKYGVWVVHQPLFCQLLGVFGADSGGTVIAAFIRKLHACYGYGSIYQLDAQTASPPSLLSANLQTAYTHLLTLDAPYEILQQGYRPDTRRHLRQAHAAGWQVEEAVDPKPLLALFRQHHAGRIPGGVAPWAYDLFENLFAVLRAHGTVALLYAVHAGRREAGAVFVHAGNRLIYLFNAATAEGRRGHARTLLIDRMIRQHAGQTLLLDFESPPVPAIAQFYEGFGAKQSAYVVVRWSRFPRLTKLWRLLQPAKLLDVHVE